MVISGFDINVIWTCGVSGLGGGKATQEEVSKLWHS